MKKLGIVRKIDDLGRLVLPKELRDKIGLQHHDEVEIYFEDGCFKIVPVSTKDKCIICENKDGVLTKYKNKYICNECIGEISK